MRLVINNVGRHDYGQYKCVAKNALGETDGTILLQSKFLDKFIFNKVILWIF